jgi:uncharacterized membrane-anchored protein
MLNTPTTEERLGRSPQKVVRYFVLIMAVVYLALGLWLFLTAGHASPTGALIALSPTSKKVLGGVFIAYGLLRFVRAYQQNFRKSSSSDETR